MSVSTYVVENCLAHSLSAFQNVLSASEKSQFAELATLPDANAVLMFTAQLDERRAANQQRCTSSRIHDFLDSVNQFSSVVDMFVSSNPNVAALIWGSVKFTFVAIVNVSSYFDKLSLILMDLRSHFPRFADYQTLYPNSQKLKDSLTRYFALTITFCQKVVEVLKRSSWKQSSLALWKPFEAEFGKIIDDIKHQNKQVTREIRYAADVAASKERQLQETERNAQRKFRSKEIALQAESEKRNRVLRNQKFMDELTTHNHEIAFRKAKKARLGNTCSWLIQSDEFKSWLHNPGLQVLHCSGKMGYGKTVSCAYVVDSILCNSTLKTTYTPLFFFCRHADATSLKPRTIIGSLIKQTLDSESMSQRMIDELSDVSKHGIADSQELCSLLISRVREHPYIILLDGLDECEKSDRIILLDALKSVVQADPRLKLYISSRPDLYPEIAKRIHISHSMSVDQPGPEVISDYIHLAVGEKIESEGLLVSNDMRLEIEEVLNKKSHGMYLWTFFQIEEICRQPSDDLIRTALQNLPRNLSETYERMLDRIYKNGPFKLVKQEFMWLSVTERPLSLNEMQEALAIDPKDLSLRRNRFVNDKLALISQCAGLVSLDEEQDTVNFTHHSIQQFLTSAFTSRSEYQWHFSTHEAEILVGKACLTYLNFGDFERQVIKPGNTVVIHPEHVLNYSFQTVSNDKATRFYSKLFAFRSKKNELYGAAGTKIDLKKLVDVEHSTSEAYPFLEYACECWLFHCRRFTEKKSFEYRQWTALLQSENDLIQLPWSLDDLHNIKSSVLTWIVNHSHMALVIYLHEMPSTPLLNSASPLKHIYIEAASKGNFELLNFIKSFMDTNSLDQEAFLAAASGEYIEILEMLLSPNSGSLNSISDGVVLNCALYEALQKEHFELTRFLTTKITKIMRISWNGETVLHAAARFGNLNVMKVLTVDQESTIVDVQNDSGETALFLASKNGHLELVGHLISRAANTDLIASKGRTALLVAAIQEHWDVVEKLLLAGSDVNCAAEGNHDDIHPSLRGLEGFKTYEKSPFLTLLNIAAGKGHIATVQHALSAGAHINAGINNDTIALELASAMNHLEVVKLLLSAGVKVNSIIQYTKKCSKALLVACECGHLQIVELLLAAGADVNSRRGMYSDSALASAAKGGHLQIVELLLTAGANANNSTGEYSIPALALATKGGHLEIVKCLLSAGADPNLKTVLGYRGDSPLQIAAVGGKTDIVEELLFAGADVDHRNKSGQTALQLAALYHRTDVQKLLLAGADVNFRNRHK